MLGQLELEWCISVLAMQPSMGSNEWGLSLKLAER